MLTQSAAERLKLRPMMMIMVYMKMFGGRTLDHYVVAHSMEIAGAHVRNHEFVLIPDDILPPSIDGILGPDILQVFDADFNFAASKLDLFSNDHCPGKVVYWTHDDYAVIPFKMDEGRHIQVDVQLDGKDVSAIIDTGSSRSLMSLETAEDMFKLDEKALSAKNGHYPFKTLTLQGITVNNPDLILVPDDKSQIMGGYREPRLILGMGVLRSSTSTLPIRSTISTSRRPARSERGYFGDALKFMRRPARFRAVAASCCPLQCGPTPDRRLPFLPSVPGAGEVAQS